MQQTKAVILMAVCFGIGSALGCLFSAQLQGDGSAALMNYLDSYLAMAGESGTVQPGWMKLCWATFRMPLLLALLRFTVLGVLLIPLAMGAKGFLLSFAISAFARSYAWKGLGAALVLFGIPEGIQIVVIFLLAVKSWVGAEEQGREKRSKEGQEELLRLYLMCGAILAGSVLLQRLLAGWMLWGLRMLLT